jgi:YD repeat-containing protein
LGTTADLANSYLYDALDRLTQVQQSSNGGNAVASKQVNFTYNADGQTTALSRYSDLSGTNLVASSTWGYDQNNRLTSLAHALGTGGTTTLSYSLGYDLKSQITSLSTPDGTSSLAYDATGQLTGASLTSESYAYDANGNRAGGTSVNADNQLASDSLYTYSYDKNGNLTSKVRKDGTGSVLYTWDYRNRLTDVVSKDGSGTTTGSVHYAYDAGNNRISKTVKDGSGAVTLSEAFVYDLSGGDNLLLVLDGSGNVKNRYLNGSSTNQVLAEETSITGSGAGTIHWALTDHEGSVRDVINNSGAVLDHIQYDSFGNRDPVPSGPVDVDGHGHGERSIFILNR